MRGVGPFQTIISRLRWGQIKLAFLTQPCYGLENPRHDQTSHTRQGDKGSLDPSAESEGVVNGRRDAPRLCLADTVKAPHEGEATSREWSSLVSK